MNGRSNPKLTGLFVIGAIALIVTGLILFGSGRLFQTRVPIVMYFTESVGGLDVGAPVTFNGVAVGVVTDIDLIWNLDDNTFLTPVYADILPDNLRYASASATKIESARRGVAEAEVSLIDRGLRAQLGLTSLLTGRLQVNLVMRPETRVRPMASHVVDPEITQIPTISSDIAQAKELFRDAMTQFSKMRVDEVISDFQEALASARELLSNPEIAATVSETRRAVADARRLVELLEARVDPVAQSVVETSEAAERAARAAERLFDDSRGAVADARRVLADAKQAFENAERLLRNANGVVEPGSPLYDETVAALREVGLAARTLRSLAEMLERDPNSILFGRR